MRAISSIIAIITLVLGGCTAPLQENDIPHRSITVRTEITDPVTFTVAGDSISAFTFQGSPRPWQTWIPSVGPEVQYVTGGCAVPGYSTVDVLKCTFPVDADVFVVLVATNDMDREYPAPAALARVESIIENAEAAHVLLVAIPPSDAEPTLARGWNTVRLAPYAAANNIPYFDPWVPYRQSSGRWVAGAAWDPLHPTAETAAAVGASLTQAILDAAAAP